MGIITAKELRTKGVSIIRNVLDDLPEAFISVRGKKRYVIMDIERFQYMRDCELYTALLEAKEDPEAENAEPERIEERLRRR